MADTTPAEVLESRAEEAAASTATLVTGASAESTPADKAITLTEYSSVGYRDGTAVPLTLVNVGGVPLEKYTGYDFLLMRIAAAMDGVALVLNSGFRSMEEQQREYRRRTGPDGKLSAQLIASMGPAAEPGHSNHQQGVAIDIAVGMTRDQYMSGDYSVTFAWLKNNAANFGFSHDEGARVKEPWHWRHTVDKVVGSVTGIALTQIRAAEFASAASSPTTSGLTRWNYLEALQAIDADARSGAMVNASRQTLLAMAVADTLQKSRGNAVVAASIRARAAAEEAGRLAAQFSPDVTYALFDFSTGLWGDGKAV